MNPEQLRQARQATPFQPFTIRMADQRTFYIPRPDFISISPTGRIVAVYHPDDSASILDALLMTELTISSSRQLARLEPEREMNTLDKFRLDGKRALITGGSRGLGRAIAQAFAEAGAGLVLVGRTRETLDTAAQEVSVLGGRVDVIQSDVNDSAAAETMCDAVLRDLGPIDILVNNVGGRREDISTENMTALVWKNFLDLNLTSAVVCTQKFGTPMLERGWGRIINIASIAGPFIAMRSIEGRHYETAKAALVGFTRSVAADWAKRGVTVNAICPGGFMTDPNRRWFGERPAFQAEFENNIPMGRLGEPEEIAPLALYLASEASSYMTGTALVLDGGYTLW